VNVSGLSSGGDGHLRWRWVHLRPDQRWGVMCWGYNNNGQLARQHDGRKFDSGECKWVEQRSDGHILLAIAHLRPDHAGGIKCWDGTEMDNWATIRPPNG